MSEYYTAYFCKKCDGELSFNAMMDSNGRCHRCGHKGKNACTIVNTYELAYTTRRVKSKKWYKLYDTVRDFPPNQHKRQKV